MFRTSIISAALVLASVATGAVAAVEPETVSRNVPYGDLDLGSAKGVTVLKRRIAHAVDLVCGDSYMSDVKSQAALDKCRTDARANANTQLALLLQTRQQMAARPATIAVAAS
jgi:UrcA family protein